MYKKKIFQDVDKQINILKEKNLSFRDEEMAKSILIRNNYYTIINGYREPFVKEDTKEKGTQYMDGAYFEEIYALFSFELDLKISLLKYIFILERNIKSAISYEFSKLYGHEDYLKVKNFDNSDNADVRELFYLFSSLQNIISRSINKNDYMSYYVENYNYVPLWVLANAMTLGNIINFYKLMKKSEKEHISQFYFGCDMYELEDYLEIINTYRNVCAHDERLYNYRANKKGIPNNKFHNYFRIKNNEKGNNDVFALLLSLCSILTKENKYRLVYELIPIFDELESNLTSINIDVILDIMGFPHNWKGIVDVLCN